MKRILAAAFILMSSISFSTIVEIDTSENKIKTKLNRRAKYPAGINLYIAGPSGIVGASFDYFIVPKFSIEVGAGIRNSEPDFGYFLGGRYHFFGNTITNITPYLGVFSGFEIKDNDIKNFNLYVPIGIQRIKKNHFSWSVEVAYQRNSYGFTQNIYGGGKIGYRF